MVKIASKEELLTFHEHSNGLKYYRQDYFEREEGLIDSPQSYLIKQLPNITNPTHFHTQNQFQVFIEGTGAFGRHEIHPYVVHYAGAYTGYGPIVAGPSGLSYFTLRAQHDPGAQFLPEKIEHLKRGPKQHFTSKQILPSSSDEMNQLKAPQLNWEHKESSIGMGVGLLRMPTHASYFFNFEPLADGVFFVVINGAIDADGQSLGVNKNIYFSSKEKSFEIVTSDFYAEVLVLQVPVKENIYL